MTLQTLAHSELNDTRIGRAVRLLRDHADEVQKLEPGTYRVPSGSEPGLFYVVCYGGAVESCECPDFVHRGSETGDACKHLLFLGILAAKRRRSFSCASCGNRFPNAERREVHEEDHLTFLQGEGVCEDCALREGVI